MMSGFEQTDTPHGDWVLERPEPTAIALVGASPELMKSPQALAERIANISGRDVDLMTPDEPVDGVEWLASISVPELAAPLLCWPEVAAGENLGLPQEVETQSAIGVQSLLHPSDPLTSLSNLLRLLTMLDDTASGILDCDTGRWFDLATLRRDLVESDIEPIEDLLWTVELEEFDSGVSIQTCGLNRCGRHELNIFLNDAEHQEVAADLIASIASLCLETPLPATDTLIEVGPGLHLKVSSAIPGDIPVLRLSSALSDGPPLDVLERLACGAAAIYRSSRSTSRHRLMAIATWDRFLAAVDSAHEQGGSCFVEVPWEDTSGQEIRREHLWMQVESVDGKTVVAKPAHEGTLVQGVPDAPSNITSDEVCSWRIHWLDEAWGPEQIEMLESSLKQHS